MISFFNNHKNLKTFILLFALLISNFSCQDEDDITQTNPTESDLIDFCYAGDYPGAYTYQDALDDYVSFPRTNETSGCGKIIVTDNGTVTTKDLFFVSVGSLNGDSNQFVMNISAVSTVDPSNLNQTRFYARFYFDTQTFIDRCKITGDAPNIFEGEGQAFSPKSWELDTDNNVVYSFNTSLEDFVFGEIYEGGMPNPLNQYDSSCTGFEQCEIGNLKASIGYKIHDPNTSNPTTVLAIKIWGTMYKLEEDEDENLFVGGEPLEVQLLFLLNSHPWQPGIW